MKKTYIINTGGTISMAKTADGYRTQPGYMAEQLSHMEELEQQHMPRFELNEYDPLIDSSDMTPAYWLKIANDIQQHYESFDGFVVLHGTDTMAYTASALAFMLQNLGKPVVLTGAQLPLGQARNDARENLKTAMMIAADYAIPEVCLLFDEQLLRGCRSTKVSTTQFDAFQSPNFPPLAEIGTDIKIHSDRLRPVPSSKLSVSPIDSHEVATFRLFPGISTDVLKNVLQRPLKALILETYGQGNGPTGTSSFLKTIQAAVDDGIIIVNCTQCLHGGVTQTRYAAGNAFSKAGVISGHDMTTEAAWAKLLHLFSQNKSTDEIRNELEQNLVGELTVQD
jgi:L-asparaginase